MHHELTTTPDRAGIFVTLTYSDANMPWDRSVSVEDLQRFMKRFRKAVSPVKVRFFGCGEYGDNLARPHYHVLIYGYDCPDGKLWRTTPAGFPSYRSAFLEQLWPFGHVEFGRVTRASAAYVARYCLKKVYGKAAGDHYQIPDPLTPGHYRSVRPEFITMSRKPGIGAEWYTRYATDAFPRDFVTIDGKKLPVPRFYKKKLTEEEQFTVSTKRKVLAFKHKDNNTPDRLQVREEVQARKASLLKRSYEREDNGV